MPLILILGVCLLYIYWVSFFYNFPLADPVLSRATTAVIWPEMGVGYIFVNLFMQTKTFHHNLVVFVTFIYTPLTVKLYQSPVN